MVARFGSLCLIAAVACARLVDLDAPDDGDDLGPAGDTDTTDTDATDDLPSDTDPLTYEWTDDFERTVANGLGAPTTGAGTYDCISAGSPSVSVSGGVARLTMPSSGGVERDVQCQIIDASAANLEVEAVLHATLGVGSLSARVAGDYTRYNLGVNFWSGGLTLARFRQAAFTSLGTGSVGTVAQDYHVRLRVEGPTSATTITATVWPVGAQEPASPTLTVIDDQGIAGRGYGFNAWMLDGTIELTVDDLRVRAW